MRIRLRSPRWPRAIFGPDRVSVASRLDDAIELGVALADEADAADGPGKAGVLITGSVITAGDARVLLPTGGGRSSEAAVRHRAGHGGHRHRRWRSRSRFTSIT